MPARGIVAQRALASARGEVLVRGSYLKRS
jgi:hypothetical protein